MKNLPQYLMYGMMGLGLLVTIIAFALGDPDDPDTWGYYEPGLYVMYAAFIMTILAVLGASVMGMMGKPDICKSGDLMATVDCFP